MWDTPAFLYVSDETINKISGFSRWQKGRSHRLAIRTGNTFDRHHRLIDVQRLARNHRGDSDGNTRSRRPLRRKRLNIPNDVIVGPDGALYFTRSHARFSCRRRNKRFPFGCLPPRRQGQPAPADEGFSPAQRTGLFPDASISTSTIANREIYRVYDVASDGTLSNGRIFGEEPGGKKDGVPDGIKVDKERKSFRHRSEESGSGTPTGNHLGTIATPEQTCKPDLGRQRLPHFVHHRHHVGVIAWN